ncbi:DNA mismatch repair protein [Drepanopeziza brunnea f. sp. 'multigermtubi' MB_m1]|uniref:DNA mismatch repair protein n=1 Tax=Marssonina brunnea f. sp. multigermtubi (strain MB_m1) TaxID=1072389 RepID=K1X732_MARBU|nr:DNA mismatch repair protein [Drepanopeziza brunnea f. sp. 'multigermtubi' MB_m1]EKD16468.1 DNA mismatch repair protein [Drepanopeziza brunnea f. sp. 'multigermtubi' MB_m1]
MTLTTRHYTTLQYTRFLFPMSIQPLPPDVVAQIKSSITVTSLNGVVRELVKNSLDAGATKIEICLDYGRGGCSVEDDGLGILPSELVQVKPCPGPGPAPTPWWPWPVPCGRRGPGGGVDHISSSPASLAQCPDDAPVRGSRATGTGPSPAAPRASGSWDARGGARSLWQHAARCGLAPVALGEGGCGDCDSDISIIIIQSEDGHPTTLPALHVGQILLGVVGQPHLVAGGLHLRPGGGSHSLGPRGRINPHPAHRGPLLARPRTHQAGPVPISRDPAVGGGSERLPRRDQPAVLPLGIRSGRRGQRTGTGPARDGAARLHEQRAERSEERRGPVADVLP